MASKPKANGYAVSRDLQSRLVASIDLTPLGRETRRHPNRQIQKLAASLEEFGFVVPIVIDDKSRVVAGWGLVLAARRLGLLEVPAIRISDLNEAKIRSLRVALNRLGEESSWDDIALKLEFAEIVELEPKIDLQTTGFEMGEIDVRLRGEDDEEDIIAHTTNAVPPVTVAGDIWILGEHKIICGNALEANIYDRLMGGENAEIVFTDPPWNVPIDGHVSGSGAVRHGEFAMASGEMSSTEFQAFLSTSLRHAAHHAADGSMHFVCMDWRRMRELLGATLELYSEMKNLCVWNKSNAGMGSLYRSKHELIFVFKKGHAAHINNVELGRFGRSRSNVWDHPGQNSLNGSAKSKLSLHPTVKPVALVADALRDCSNRNGIVLDPFGGAGTTLIAAEKSGRRARLIEIEPRFVDATVERWQQLTGLTSTNALTGVSFKDRSAASDETHDDARDHREASEHLYDR